jgi:hypothetical protein
MKWANASLAALQTFARSRPPVAPDQERCELCGVGVTARHDHLLEPATRALRCACAACTVLFGQKTGRYHRVHHRVERLENFQLDDAAWARLRIPIGIVFFVKSGDSVAARFPSPAGATEALIERDDWQRLVAGNPVLIELAPEVEALLVRRLGETREHFRVSLDECYRLVGLVRQKWRGFAGGLEVEEAIDGFFAELRNA